MKEQYDDFEIPELTMDQLKRMKPNPYVKKISNEQKIINIVEAYLSYGNIDKKKLKEQLDVVLA